jgi:hypothetical protein
VSRKRIAGETVASRAVQKYVYTYIHFQTYINIIQGLYIHCIFVYFFLLGWLNVLRAVTERRTLKPRPQSCPERF